MFQLKPYRLTKSNGPESTRAFFLKSLHIANQIKYVEHTHTYTQLQGRSYSDAWVFPGIPYFFEKKLSILQIYTHIHIKLGLFLVLNMAQRSTTIQMEQLTHTQPHTPPAR
jgi:hypothetical protein